MTVLQLQPSQLQPSRNSASLCVLRVLRGETYIIMCLLMENFTIAIAVISVSAISMGS